MSGAEHVVGMSDDLFDEDNIPRELADMVIRVCGSAVGSEYESFPIVEIDVAGAGALDMASVALTEFQARKLHEALGRQIEQAKSLAAIRDDDGRRVAEADS